MLSMEALELFNPVLPPALIENWSVRSVRDTSKCKPLLCCFLTSYSVARQEVTSLLIAMIMLSMYAKWIYIAACEHLTRGWTAPQAVLKRPDLVMHICCMNQNPHAACHSLKSNLAVLHSYLPSTLDRLLTRRTSLASHSGPCCSEGRQHQLLSWSICF